MNSKISKVILSGPLNFPASKTVVEHDELPPVTNELSVTLRLNLQSHDSGWITIFQKGADKLIRAPALYLTPNDSQPCPRFSTNIDKNSGIDAIGKGFVLNKWYHIGYTLSDLHKRLDFYIDGKWVGFKSIEQVQKEYIVFNKDPLRIGHSFYAEFKGQMSNFCYYNWRLSADEIANDFIMTYETYQ
ncbi:4438_t:CDS:2 [Diversispora eburnea]|uniref:4438_t:CDS:1 n=1 Tax=Diversispora eburnea TaxID=1213867 RepID=A0A9N8ZRV4_9GLOM|nr:4438_t:CDS:2 [Diversispora eburnea]